MLYYHLSPRESGLLIATGTKVTAAILENDIVKRDRQERTVRFLRETTVLARAKARAKIVKD